MIYINLQKHIETLPPRGHLKLKPGEYVGPVEVNNPAIIEGNNTTIWGRSGPVLKINSRGVVLKNLVVEVTGNQSPQNSQIAIETDPKYGPLLENVVVRGRVKGFDGESGLWDYPPSLILGALPYGEHIKYKIRLIVPVVCKIQSNVAGITFIPSKIGPGISEVSINIEPLVQNSIICGYFQLVSRFIRRIPVSGIVNNTKKNEHVGDQFIWSPGNVGRQIQNTTSQHLLEHLSQLPKKEISSIVKRLDKGHRVDLVSEDAMDKLVLDIGWQSRVAGIEMDAVVFLLGPNEKVLKDNDFIFYSNRKSAEGSVELLGASSGIQERISIDFCKIHPKHNRIAVVLSIFKGKEKRLGFSQMSGVFVRVRNATKGQDLYIYEKTQSVTLETTLIMVELYRHKGKWKMAAVGSGYWEDLEFICRKYGLEVEG